jgi:steroid 5-alpha reductase family enzyme
MDFVQSRPLLAASLIALASLVALAACTWLASVVKRDVSIVDSVWSLLILLAAITYAMVMPDLGARGSPDNAGLRLRPSCAR